MQYWPRITQNEDAVCFSLISVVVTDTTTGRQLTGTFWLTTAGHAPSMKTVKAETQVRLACYSTWRTCSQVAPQTRRVAGTIKNAACWLAQLWAPASVALLYSPPRQEAVALSMAWALLVTVKPIHQQSCSQAILIWAILQLKISLRWVLAV